MQVLFDLLLQSSFQKAKNTLEQIKMVIQLPGLSNFFSKMDTFPLKNACFKFFLFPSRSIV